MTGLASEFGMGSGVPLSQQVPRTMFWILKTIQQRYKNVTLKVDSESTTLCFRSTLGIISTPRLRTLVLTPSAYQRPRLGRSSNEC
jgi:hypothetical protein